MNWFGPWLSALGVYERPSEIAFDDAEEETVCIYVRHSKVDGQFTKDVVNAEKWWEDGKSYADLPKGEMNV